ncbi:sugar phosphate isomerase/epimerase [Amycolatopsis sp. K13G38]|uniref:Sugar phosphate isomerase/epimerase n=1 Tax=Amycolatopsis acididurans TaxID=2724524 RepID=A0ABX1JDM5_9PSEU|nr:sugar phosphate isomerase/epimerase family protein [Amycolatopsis acididurans]NKQ57898.1 sugar phosphate isomerase/epimerase [Amycolatopsis acididurans]
MTAPALALGGTTYSWLHQATLTEALGHLADAGFRQVEITSAAPHLQARGFGKYERHELLRTLRSLGLAVSSTNPGFLDINLISPGNGFRRASVEAILDELELAHDLEAPVVIVMPGRRHALSPAPDEACRWWLDQALGILLERAERLGVTIALETNPYGYLGDARDLSTLVDHIGHRNLGIAYDVANTINQEDAWEGVRTAGHRIRIAHMSDTWRARWAHTSPGRGEVDFERFGEALRSVGFDGVTIFELIDMEPPLPRLHDDIAAFGKLGWSTAETGCVPAFSTRKP